MEKDCKHAFATIAISIPQLENSPAVKWQRCPNSGKIVSRNITQDPEIGIGNGLTRSLLTFIRTGINPFTGKYSPPYMPKLMHISDEDLNSIIAFRIRMILLYRQTKQKVRFLNLPSSRNFCVWLLSNHFLFRRNQFRILIPLINWSGESIWPCISSNVLPVTARILKRWTFLNRKISGILRRRKCDEKWSWWNDYHAQSYAGWRNRYREMDWRRICKAVKFGIVPNGPALRNPMVPFAQLTDEEAKAIYAYLRTVPKIKHAISRGL